MKNIFSLLGIICFSLLSACGGGGGGSGTPETSSSRALSSATSVSSLSASSRDPSVAYAGVDRTVNMGAKVNLDAGVTIANTTGFTFSRSERYFEVRGESTVPTDVVKFRWVQLAGPEIVEYTTGNPIFTFTAPAVGTEDSAVMTFRLELTTLSGVVTEDTVNITVNRVNESPIALTSPSLKTTSGSTVTLSSGNSCDPDGLEVSYQWNQVSGPTVSLSNSTSAMPSFTAPQVDQETMLSFRLTVRDKNGASSSQNVEVVVFNPVNPNLLVDFPVTGQLMSTSKVINAFGRVSANEGATITKVTVNSGSGPIDAELLNNGKWKLSNVQVQTPSALTVTAYDSVGRVTEKNVYFRTVYPSSNWHGTQTISLDEQTGNTLIMSGPPVTETINNRVYNNRDVSLYSVSPNGNRNLVVSPYCQGGDQTIVWQSSTILDNGFYVSSNQRGVESHIMRFDLRTGVTSTVAGFGNGSGIDVEYYGSLAADKTNQRLLVRGSNLGVGKLFSLSPDTYERTQLINTNEMSLIAFDDINNTIYSTTSSVFDIPKFHKTQLSDADPKTVLISQFGKLGEGAEPKTIRLDGFKGLYFDKTKPDQVFVFDALANLIKIDVATGNREQYFKNDRWVTSATISDSGLFYFTENAEDLLTPQALMVVDFETGAKIKVSH